ncbi:MAG: CoA transferase [Acidimicrobiales bacterium]|nr:CoA transferase [Acidimicrobiales bacterium]HRW39484.1 CoA transferase [Aquihabitans sp.]
MAAPGPADGPLHDLRVVDLATVVAGPGCARYLGDFGADVIKVERPGTGDTTRAMGWTHPDDDVSLWWKLEGRNKRSVVADLKDPDDLALVRRLIATADVVVENFRPGTLERLGLDPAELIAAHPTLVVTRVTGFGQDGPYAHRPGFATLAEAMSGFAAINGEPDGGPLLPPIALTDEVTALSAAFATMVALHSGVGQVVDVNLLESLVQLMGPLLSLWELRGELQPRLGSGIPYSVPRGTYRCADDRWVAISTSAESVAVRVMELIGLGDDPRLAGFAGRIAHRDEVDRVLGAWCAARPLAEVLRAFEEAHAAAAPVYDMAELAADPHVAARGTVVDLDGTPMQGLVARLSATPGRLRWAGRALGADTDAVRQEVGPPDV